MDIGGIQEKNLRKDLHRAGKCCNFAIAFRERHRLKPQGREGGRAAGTA